MKSVDARADSVDPALLQQNPNAQENSSDCFFISFFAIGIILAVCSLLSGFGVFGAFWNPWHHIECLGASLSFFGFAFASLCSLSDPKKSSAEVTQAPKPSEWDF